MYLKFPSAEFSSIFAPMTDEKKTCIVSTAATLFLKYGIKSVTMDDIAQEAGVSKKTLYQLFKDKKTLVEEFINAYFFCNPALQILHGEGLNAIDKVLKIREQMVEFNKLMQVNLAHDLKRNYPEIFTRLEEFKRKRIYEDDKRLLTQGIEEGLFRAELDTHFLARMTVGRFLLLFNPENELFSEEETLGLELFDKMLDYHFHGVCSEKGIQYYKVQLNKLQNENPS